MVGGRLFTVALVCVTACGVQASPKAVTYPHRSAGRTGTVRINLPAEIAWGRVWVDGESIQTIESATDLVVISRLPPGIHEIAVSGPDGRLVGARVEVEAGVTTRVAPGAPGRPTATDVVRARPASVPRELIRPCSGFRFASRIALFLPAFGVRACLPLGRHVTIEATATTLLAQFLGDVGFTVHPGSNDDVPYLALRGGIYANVVVGGYAVTPSIGWRFGERYLEAGPLVVFLIDEENEHFDTIVGASLMFGKN